MRLIIACILVFDLGFIGANIGSSTDEVRTVVEAEEINDMQGNYQGYKTQHDMEQENCIIGEATSEHVEETVRQEYVGNFELTAYTWTGNPCADGEYPRASHTVACNDPRLWHEWIYIEGYGTYYCHDRTGVSSNVIDIYMDDYDSCIQFGRQSARVYIVR